MQHMQTKTDVDVKEIYRKENMAVIYRYLLIKSKQGFCG